jgi:hypothetical protein
VLWSVGLRNESDLASVLERVTAGGTPTQDISSIEEAQVCKINLGTVSQRVKYMRGN